MNKIFSSILLLASVAVLFSCKSEEDDIFDKSAAERLIDIQKTFTDRLVDSEGGWVMEYYPGTNDIYPFSNGNLLLMKFYADNTVNIATKNPPVQQSDDFADYIVNEERLFPQEFRNAFKNHELLSETSLWEVITDNGPVLTFDSYNSVMHYLSDPGFGIGGDYEFLLIDVPENGQIVKTKGKKRNFDIRMTRLPAGTDFEEYLDDVQGFTAKVFPVSLPNELRLMFGDDAMNIKEIASGMPVIYPNGKDAITLAQQNPYLITKRDGQYYLRFRDDINNSDTTKTAREFVYDAANEKFVDVDNAENYIAGYPPAEFVNARITEGGSWSLARSAEGDMSPKMKQLLDAVNSDFAVSKLSLRSYEEGKIIWNIALLTSYIYDIAETPESALSFSYLEPSGTRGTTRYNESEATKQLVAALSQEFIITSATGSSLNLGKVKFTAKNDADLWFVLTVNN